jgi:hypothetical protein
MSCSPSNVTTGTTTRLALALLLCAPAAIQAQARPQPRRQFVSFSLDNFYTQPLHFGSWPVEQLVGRDVAEAQRESYDYRSRDERTTIDVTEFERRGRGLGLTVYPFGMSTGATLGLRVSREDLPVIRMNISGPAEVSKYALTDARAYDGSVGVYVSDRAPGWGLGSHAFAAGGAGLIRSGLGDGQRLFAEAGGGLNVGPIGVQLAIKVAFNRLAEPVEHRFITVPVALRASVSF